MKNIRALWSILFICIVFVFSCTTAQATAPPSASPPVVGTPSTVTAEVDYTTMTVTLSNSSGGYFISVDKQKNWDVLDGNVLDISIFSSSRENLLYFRGTTEATDVIPLEVKLVEEEKKFKAVYNALTKKFTFSDSVGTVADVSRIEYRIGTLGGWQQYSDSIDFTRYQLLGASIQFRLKATKTTRPSKIASVKISKKANGPSVKLDGSKLFISGIKAGSTEYSLNNGSSWSMVTNEKTVKTIPLVSLPSQGSATNPLPAPTPTVSPVPEPNNTPVESRIVWFRTAATDKKAVSRIKVLEFGRQPVLEQGKASLNAVDLTIADASNEKQYEFTTVLKNETLNMERASWSTVKSTKPVTIKKVGKYQPSIGDKVYVRLKSTTDKKTKKITLASTFVQLTIEKVYTLPTATPVPTPTSVPTLTPPS